MVYKTFMLIILSSVVIHSSSAYLSVFVPKSEKIQDYSSPIENDKCQDTENILLLNLRNVGLQRIRSDFAVSPNISCLNLEDNEIGYVSSTAFQRMPNLLYLNLARNKICLTNISDLHNHYQLRTLILDNNDCNENSIFKFNNNFPRMLNLYLRGNGLSDIKSLSFAPKLTQLYLSSNNLGDSKLSFLNDAPQTLTSLDLVNNSINSLNVGKFSSVKQLRLDNNKIKKICGKSDCDDSALILEGAVNLESLSLTRNGLVSIESDAFDDTENLLDLDLSYNQIDIIRKNTFEKVSTLRNLSLKDNLLSTMPDLCGPEYLQSLSLANNQIEVINNDSFCLMTKLKYIDLSDNKIKSIEDEAFQNLSYLEILNLSNNHLASFPNMWLYYLNNLRILFVNDNKLKNIRDLALHSIRKQGNLKKVYLQNNQITKFDTNYLCNGFRSVPNITLELFDYYDQSMNSKYNKPNVEARKCNCSDNNNEIDVESTTMNDKENKDNEIESGWKSLF